jgi:hypothetical protein
MGINIHRNKKGAYVEIIYIWRERNKIFEYIYIEGERGIIYIYICIIYVYLLIN